MAYSITILEEAASEYRQIVHYLAKVLQSPQAARGFIEEFDSQVARIRTMPELYAASEMPELAKMEYRAFQVNSYLVLYRIEDTQVHIAHIFHQSQNYTKLI